MRFAFPRQREIHLYKKKLLDPQGLNTSVDILQLKKEFMRLEKEKFLKTSHTKGGNTDLMEKSDMLWFQLDSG